MKSFLQRTSDLVLISKPYVRSGRMVPFYFSVKNARNERPPFRTVISGSFPDIRVDLVFRVLKIVTGSSLRVLPIIMSILEIPLILLIP